MMELTKEEQIQAIYGLKVGYTLGHADIAMLKAMARQLLAGMEQEPVAWQWFYYKQWFVTNDPQRAKDVAEGGDVTVQPLYAAPQLPQPAVIMPDEMAISDDMNLFQKSFAQGHNACLYAILQGQG